MRIRFGECLLDSETRQLFVRGETVHVHPKAFQFLELLLENRPKAVSKSQIHEKLWPGTFVSDSTLTSLLVEVRDVIGDEARRPLYVRTVHRFGYAFCGSAQEAREAVSSVPARNWSCWILRARRRMALEPGETVIGRDPGAGLFIDDPSVSRRHARIVVTSESATLEDLGSKKGTWLVDRRRSGATGRRRPDPHRHRRADVPDVFATEFDSDGGRPLASMTAAGLGAPRWLIGRICLAGSLLLTATGLLAQATGTTTADLRGLVVDEAGSALPGASITVTNQENGFSRHATSDAGGSFAIRLLPPGLYRVSASLPGLRAADVPNVRLSVGATTSLELHLEPSEVAEAVLVTAKTALIDRTSTELSKTVGEAKIRNLPINQRNFLEFALTTPGVTVSRGPQRGPFPTSGISINGQSPRYNNIVVDGVDNNDTAVGSVRSTFSQEAVREYQVIQSPFPAEYGKTAGGVVNVVTRSGTNEWHGSAFAFFRDKSLSADNFLSGTRTPFQQKQYGGSLSGPVLRDRLFFFAAAERLTVDDANVVTISDADVAMIRSTGFDVQNGVLPFDRNGTTWLGKLDLLPSPSHALSLRRTYARELDENQQPWGGLVARSNGGVRNIEDAAIALSGTSILTASLSNELRGLYADRSHRFDSLDPHRSPQVTILGVATFGTQLLLPQPRDTQVYEIFDAISWFGGRSAYKAGFDYTHTAAWGAHAESLPDERNTVTLSPDVKDARGLPVAQVTYTWGDNDVALAYLPLAWVGDHYLNYAQGIVAGFCMACPESGETIEQDRREIGEDLARRDLGLPADAAFSIVSAPLFVSNCGEPAG